MVPVIGVEPIRYRYHWILSPARLPIPSHRPISFGFLPNAYSISQLFLKIKSFFVFFENSFLNPINCFRARDHAPLTWRTTPKLFYSMAKAAPLGRLLPVFYLILLRYMKDQFSFLRAAMVTHAPARTIVATAPTVRAD